MTLAKDFHIFLRVFRLIPALPHCECYVLIVTDELDVFFYPFSLKLE